MPLNFQVINFILINMINNPNNQKFLELITFSSLILTAYIIFKDNKFKIKQNRNSYLEEYLEIKTKKYEELIQKTSEERQMLLEQINNNISDEKIQEHLNIYKNLKENINTNNKAEEIITNLQNNDKSQELIKVIENIIKDKNKFLDNSLDLLTNYFNFLQTLPLEIKLAIFNLSGSVFIFLFVTSVISIYLSELLIKYFNIETKYPKLVKLIE